MNKGDISNFIRTLKLSQFVDLLRYAFQKIKNRKKNRAFKLANPLVSLPPDYLIYESFQLDYEKYYSESKITAVWLVNHFEKHIELKDKNILDWGCGPGRIIRHLPEIIDSDCKFYGTDYNKSSIEWCQKNIKSVSFNHNSLEANLPYPDDYFDVIYGISIFTHLSEKLHKDWYNELRRILNPAGIIFLTTQGDNFKEKLTASELKDYEKGNLVVRGKVKEGHRTYSAFHPKQFLLKIFSNDQVLEHIEIIPEKNRWLPQDIWIVRKKVNS